MARNSVRKVREKHVVATQPTATAQGQEQPVPRRPLPPKRAGLPCPTTLQPLSGNGGSAHPGPPAPRALAPDTRGAPLHTVPPRDSVLVSTNPDLSPCPVYSFLFGLGPQTSLGVTFPGSPPNTPSSCRLTYNRVPPSTVTSLRLRRPASLLVTLNSSRAELALIYSPAVSRWCGTCPW